MSSKYGFDEEATGARPVASSLSLPGPKQSQERPSEQDVMEAARSGQSLGFVSREPRADAEPRRYVRKRKVEVQDKLMIAGPLRVLDEFRAYCDREGVSSYWAGLERLVEATRRNG